ncbi:MAG: glycosyltransferase family 4 protein, partial [Halioglobus sp.]|nr:glycosyltransferase family 4 protein [Halioglobus sp.]
RSSHAQSTPLGGGLPLFLAFAAGLLLAQWSIAPWPPGYPIMTAACAALVALGFYDDLRSLSVRLRLAIYALVVIALAALLMRDYLAAAGWPGGLLLLAVGFAMLWLLNLYNFMDGIDGIAGLQAVLACVGAALLSDPSPEYARFCLLFAAACGGFLVWNLPPARLFMGDAGSVPIGLLLGALALLGWLQGHLNPACWLILLALFITDATWTLLWRMTTGQAFTSAHRLHAYQRLSRYWDSHGRVDLLLVAAVLLWLLPLAWCAQRWPAQSWILVILAYLPWVIGMVKIRAIK